MNDYLKREFWWGCAILAGLLMLCLLSYAGCQECEQTAREAIKAGLVQSTGQSAGQWVKPEK
jgi:hypothetical protein